MASCQLAFGPGESILIRRTTLGEMGSQALDVHVSDSLSETPEHEVKEGSRVTVTVGSREVVPDRREGSPRAEQDGPSKCRVQNGRPGRVPVEKGSN